MASLADRLFTFARVVASSLGAQNGSVQVNLRVSAEDDEEGLDGSTNEPLFTGPAMIRPLAPTDAGAAEVVVARVTDGLQPIALRDLRLSKARGNMNEGVTTLPGYGGAFVSIDYEASSGTDAVTIYVPDDSSPKKASLALFDKAQMVFLHKRGQYVALYDDGSIALISPDGKSFVKVSNDGIALSGALKTVTGALFGDVVSAAPIMVVPAVSATWAAQVTTTLQVIVGMLQGPPGPPAPLMTGALAALLVTAGVPGGVVVPPPVVSTKASASP